MKRLFKRSATVLLVLVLIFAMTAMSVSAFVPPGQAKKMADMNEENMPKQGWARWFGWRFLESEDDKYDLEGLPPGIAKKNIPLPPGLMRFVNDRDNLPPGIWNRFMERWQERERDEWWDEKKLVVIGVSDLDDLKDALDDEAEGIKLLKHIELDNVLRIDWDLHLIGNGFDLYASNDFEDDWMIVVEKDAHLVMTNLTLDGDDEPIKGLVKVEEGAKLTLEKTTLRGLDEDESALVFVEEDGELVAKSNNLADAPIGFHVMVEDIDEDRDDLDKMADKLVNDNIFDKNVTYLVRVHDRDGYLFNRVD